MKETEKAFIAGFLDADGSVYVRLKPNKSYRFDFQVAPYIVFFQKEEKAKVLAYIKNLLKVGYLRTRKDGVVEYTIGDVDGLKKVIKTTILYSVLKKEQLQLIDQILSFKKKIRNGKDFLKLAKMIDQFEILNYSKKRTINSQEVEVALKRKKLL